MSVGVFLLDDHELVRAGLRTLIEDTDDLVVVGRRPPPPRPWPGSHRPIPGWPYSTCGFRTEAASRSAGRSGRSGRRSPA